MGCTCNTHFLSDYHSGDLCSWFATSLNRSLCYLKWTYLGLPYLPFQTLHVNIEIRSTGPRCPNHSSNSNFYTYMPLLRICCSCSCTRYFNFLYFLYTFCIFCVIYMWNIISVMRINNSYETPCVLIIIFLNFSPKTMKIGFPNEPYIGRFLFGVKFPTP